jgi:putative endonuclease
MPRVSGKPYFLYILWSVPGKRFYIGISDNPERRLEQHNSPNQRGWTRRYQPWTLIYREEHADYGSARRRENELKAQKGGVGLFLKTGLNPEQFRRGS